MEHKNKIILASVSFLSLYLAKDFLFNKIAMVIDHYINLNKKKNRAKRIILIRHGESEANIDPKLYDIIPDNKIRLSEDGIKQAKIAGENLKKIVKEEKLNFYVSPLKRTEQTFNMVSSFFAKEKWDAYFDPRLREQEWGNYQNQEKMNEIWIQRDKVGKFFYRFGTGESGADVYDRCSLFLGSLFRDMQERKMDNVVIVTHGLFMRLFAMRFMKWTVEEFESLANPKNCEIWVFEKDLLGRYRLVNDVRKIHS